MEIRFEALQREMNARFEAMDKRFESLERRLTFTQWFIGAGFTLITIVITVFKLYVR
jgi:glutathione S-transferase